MVTPNLAVRRWITDWFNQNALEPFVDDFKRIFPVPIIREKSGLLEQITDTFQFRWPRLSK
ncbi:MAG: hypothetical protein OEQ12_00100 [Nitrosopumilus sp.]|nr:hypothetical protein [Nitrosopumilus sp.]